MVQVRNKTSLTILETGCITDRMIYFTTSTHLRNRWHGITPFGLAVVERHIKLNGFHQGRSIRRVFSPRISIGGWHASDIKGIVHLNFNVKLILILTLKFNLILNVEKISRFE